MPLPVEAVCKALWDLHAAAAAQKLDCLQNFIGHLTVGVEDFLLSSPDLCSHHTPSSARVIFYKWFPPLLLPCTCSGQRTKPFGQSSHSGPRPQLPQVLNRSTYPRSLLISFISAILVFRNSISLFNLATFIRNCFISKRFNLRAAMTNS